MQNQNIYIDCLFYGTATPMQTESRRIHLHEGISSGKNLEKLRDELIEIWKAERN